MNRLRRELAPISQKAWEEIEEQAVLILKANLSARKVVDVVGPKGLDYTAVSLGRLEQKGGDVPFGINKILPLIETRLPFTMDRAELDNADRGAEDIEFGDMEDMARKLAFFEEKAIYEGLIEGGIEGLSKGTEYETLACPKDSNDLMCTLPKALSAMKANAIEGPFHLVTNPGRWQDIMSQVKGYPLNRHIRDIIGGNIVMAPAIENMVLMSSRGGDFQLHLGQDISIGYDRTEGEKIHMYFTHSFTFRILEPKAVMVFN